MLDDGTPTDTPAPGLNAQEAQRPLLTVKEAALAAGIHHNTVRRRLAEGAFPNAERRPADGAWLIPVTDLLGAGLHLHSVTPTEIAVTDEHKHEQPDQLTQLQHERDDWRRRAEVAEAVARERAEALSDARLALRALTAGKVDESQPIATAPATPTTVGVGAKRRWWSRTRS